MMAHFIIKPCRLCFWSESFSLVHRTCLIIRMNLLSFSLSTYTCYGETLCLKDLLDGHEAYSRPHYH